MAEKEESPKLFLSMLLIASLVVNMIIGIYAINVKQTKDRISRNFSIEREVIFKELADCRRELRHQDKD